MIITIPLSHDKVLTIKCNFEISIPTRLQPCPCDQLHRFVNALPPQPSDNSCLINLCNTHCDECIPILFFLLYICIHISFIFYFHFLTFHSEIRSQCSASSINLNGSPRIVVIVIAGDAFRSDHHHPACHYCESVSECNGAVPKCRAIACENERIVCVCVCLCVQCVCV